MNSKPRPSLLPKLALCGQYVSQPGESSPAAERGSRLDEVFRHAWTTGELISRDLPDEDVAAVRWAVNECIRLGGGKDRLVTDEAACKIQIPGIPAGGTADGIAVKGQWLIDIKTGQIYDYKHQMAAYSLGLMAEHLADEWTAHLLFIDQRKIVSHRFPLHEALRVVKEALDNVGKEPVPNEFCGWCAKNLTCSARTNVMETTITTTEGSFLALIEDPERLGDFLQRCAVLEDFRDAAKLKARQMLEAGTQVPGWRLQKARTTEYVEAEHIAQAVANGQIGAGDAIRAAGSLSAKKAQELFSAAGATMPEEIVSKRQGMAPLVATKY